jgi:hypothetical protein
MTPQEKYLLTADIIFALLSIWFFFPRCKMPLWKRVIGVAFVWGMNYAAFCYDNNNGWMLSHSETIYLSLCNFIAVSAILSWVVYRRRGLL